MHKFKNYFVKNMFFCNIKIKIIYKYSISIYLAKSVLVYEIIVNSCLPLLRNVTDDINSRVRLIF